MHLGDFLRLVRLPNTLSAAGQILAGSALASAVSGRRPGAESLVAGGLGAMCLYAFGMALNDWYDRERDRLLHPDRPIPSGRISPRAALTAALLLLGAGLGLFFCADPVLLLAGLPLALAIAAYDGPLKSRPVPAAVTMGLCRALCATAGLLLGGLAEARLAGPELPALLRYPASYLLLVTLVTAVSQKEEAGERPAGLGPLAVLTGLAFLLPLLAAPDALVAAAAGLLALLVMRGGLGAAPRAGRVVKEAIFALPLFDALWAWAAEREMAAVCVLLYLLGFPLRALIGQRSS